MDCANGHELPKASAVPHTIRQDATRGQVFNMLRSVTDKSYGINGERSVMRKLYGLRSKLCD